MKKLGIKGKLIAINLILSIGITLVAFFGYLSSSKLNYNIDFLVNNSLPVIRNVTLIDMVHDGIHACVLDALLGKITNDVNRIEDSQKEFLVHKNSINDYLNTILAKEIPDQLKMHLEENKVFLQEYIDSAQKVINAAKSNSKDIDAVTNEFEKQFNVLVVKLDTFADEIEKMNNSFFAQVIKLGQIYQGVLILVFLITIIVSFILSYLISTKLVSKLTQISNSIHHEANELGVTSSEMNKASCELSSSTQQQAAAIEETSSAISEISGMVNKSSAVATETETFANESRRSAQKGSEIVIQMTKSVQDINSKNDEIAIYMNENNDKTFHILDIIKDVNTKTKVINDIVFQTKILSFNASVEAARAGDEGRGFAVVAEEVGNLAQMSGNAAKDINILLDSSLVTVSNIVEETRVKVDSLLTQAKLTIQNGTRISGECAEILNELVSTFEKISSLVTSISQASRESAKGVIEISSAMQQLNSLTQANNQLASITSTHSNELSKKMNHLKQAAENLNKVIFGY